MTEHTTEHTTAHSTTAPRRRVSAAARREDLLATAVDLARADGVGSLTLARVAAAGGVTKPVAYQHFGTLTGLLRAMHARIGTAQEEQVLARLATPGPDGATPGPAERAHALSAAYLDCCLDDGALHDEIGAALVAAGDDGAPRVDPADRYAQVAAEVLGLDEPAAFPVVVAFLGAADRLCDAVLAGRLTRDDAVRTLAALLGAATDASGRTSAP
ncbi:TetR/AcrR family transcriptional regulator [Cellulosimicrobium marinum]|uniref:TetR/AcrR family transcriptional regulator n=1 Tax=Cellulosimicrobium marinum TaxID=1638992 RepID=UPI001E43259F|nr:TetR family transcriptional regulator [Cellulosimicrobium marinum]MCB7135034.1 TetR/AcrR family transcriptional regulator [Cellulosimicrobium marinum]